MASSTIQSVNRVVTVHLLCILLTLSLVWGQSVYLSLGTGNPMITTNNTDILITAIGDELVDVDSALACRTDLVQCCRGSDHNGTGGLGKWLYPDGTEIPNSAGGQDFFIRRNDPQLIRLSRRMPPAATSPVGLYCCVIPTTMGEMTFCTNLVVMCPSLTAPTNGMITYDPVSPISVRTVATYQCDSGYTLNPEGTRTCQNDGTWSGVEPTCEGCGPPPSITNGSPGPPTSTTFGGTVTYSCNSGYFLSGLPTVSCMPSGSWSTRPTCIATCDDLTPPNNGAIAYSPTSSPRLQGTTATHSCDNGYELSGGTMRTCQSNRTWSGGSITCQLTVDCGPPPSITNGSPGTPTSTTLGGTVTYSCNNGYILSGSATVSCLSTGSWSTRPKCTAIATCDDLTPPTNGVITYSPTSSPRLQGATATYRCNTGYKLSGGTVRTCQSDRAWSGGSITCQRDCGPPPSITNGFPGTPTRTTLGGTVTYSCNSGYILSGSATVSCLSSGSWSTRPTCTATCNDLSTLNNGFITYNPNTSPRLEGTTATYDCDTRYTGGTVRTCQSDRTWSGGSITCQPVDCGPPPSITNGSRGTLTRTTFGGTMTYSCNDGFILSGSAMITCLATGSWSTPPSCLAVPLVYLSLSGTNYLTSNPEIVISSIGDAKEDALVCHTDLATCCRADNDPTNPDRVGRGDWMFPNGTVLPAGTTVTSDTNVTYRTRDKAVIRLHRRGTITTPTGTYCCMIPTSGGGRTFCANLVDSITTTTPTLTTTMSPVSTCSDLPPPANGMVVYSSGPPNTRPVSSTVTYSCNNGYSLNGGSTRTCQNGGTWSGGEPTCEVVNCGQPPSITNGSPGTPTSTTFGGTVTYSCSDGLIISGSAMISCLATGMWDTQPSCTDPPPVYLSLSSTNYLTSNMEILLSSVGEGAGSYLTCRTDDTNCCREAESGVVGGVGAWHYPNGSVVQSSSDGGDFHSSRDGPMVVNLNRRNDVMGPTGNYCCVVPTSTGNQTFCANLVTSISVTVPPTPGGSAAGIVIGVIVVLILLVVVVVVGVVFAVYFWRRLRENREKYTPSVRRPPPARTPPFSAAFSKQGNGEGTATIEKVVEPSIVVFPSNTKATEGEDVYLKVKVGGHPPPTITWYHNGTVVTADYATELDDDGGISFPCIETKHSGVYKLVVSSPSGAKVDKQLELTVLGEGETVDAEDLDFSSVPVAQFGAYVNDYHNNSNEKFRDHYKGLDPGEKGHIITVSRTPENRVSNRFGNIAVYDDNRIALQPISGQEDCQSDYINACYVDGYSVPNKFIATQGPLPRTLVDFWRLMWQERPTTIVMLTNLKEGTKIKCQPYWPDSGQKKFGPFAVTITDQQVFADYTIRTLNIKLSGDRRSLKVTQFHFTAWPDHGVPEYATPVLAYHRRVRAQHNPSKGPLVVHCSAGVGRTGTYIAIDNVLEQIEAEQIVDISGVIVRSRNQRMKLVQTEDQYIFIHDAILEFVTCGDTQISAGDLRNTIQKMSRKDPSKGMSRFEQQFKILEQVSPNPSEINCGSGKKHSAKNRGTKFLPLETGRVILKGEQPDYIHAAYANGYKHQKAYIIAQNPLPSTVRNFWKVIYERKCAAVVMLTQINENKREVCSQYWPESDIVSYGEYTVENLGEEAFPGFTIRSLSVLYEKTQVAHQVTQFHVMNWTEDGVCANLKTVTDVNEEVVKVQRRTGNKPILVHCTDTATRSGIFCAISTTIDRCKTEGVVDVFQVVKALRVHKPGAVPTVENYQSVFDGILVFLDSFDTYANFQEI